MQNNPIRKYQNKKSLPKKNTMPERKSFLEKSRNVRKTLQTKSLLYCLNNYYATGSRVAYLSYLVFCGAGADERSLYFCHSSIATTPTIADFTEVFTMNLSSLLKITSTSSKLRCRLVHECLPHNFLSMLLCICSRINLSSLLKVRTSKH